MATKAKKGAPKESSRTAPKESSRTGKTKYAFSEQIEELKEQLDGATKNAKEHIRTIIAACTGSYEKAIEANKKYVDELRNQLKGQHIDTSFFDEITNAFASSLEVSDEVIDSIIDSHMRRTNRIAEFHRKNLETLSKAYATDKVNYEDFLKLFQKNFEESIEHSTQDMKKVVDVYNKHLNLTVNFNKSFSKNINSQVDTMVKLQSKGLQAYSNWVANWWEKDK
jgi:ElaB/YqjD/DUF883 family membrane-anchored ribosome-binding protein